MRFYTGQHAYYCLPAVRLAVGQAGGKIQARFEVFVSQEKPKKDKQYFGQEYFFSIASPDFSGTF